MNSFKDLLFNLLFSCVVGFAVIGLAYVLGIQGKEVVLLGIGVIVGWILRFILS